MKRHTLLYVLAGLFALVATGFALNWAQNRPTLVTIAVGPAASETDRVIRAFERSFSNERSGIRFRILQTGDSAESAKALDAGKAQFAVLRSDSDISETGQTVAILNRRPVVIVARRSERIEGFVDLAQKRVGLVRVTDSSRPLFDKIAQSFDFQANTINAIEVQAAQAAEALLREDRKSVV